MTDEPPMDEAMDPPESPTAPEPGQDSTVEDWMGQSVDRDRQLAEDLANRFDEVEAEKRFNQQATGRAEQESRHGSSIDPDQGQSAYREPD